MSLFGYVRRMLMAPTTLLVLMAGGSAWVSDVGVAVSPGSNQVTVRVTATVVRIVPFGSFSVSASGSAPIEHFIAQPERP